MARIKRTHGPTLRAALAACLFSLFFLIRPVTGVADTEIYYYRDAAGVFHFTNTPTSQKYKVYAVFKSLRVPMRDSDQRRRILALARKYSRLYGMDEKLVESVIEVESGYQPEAVSSAGAEGVMQIMPGTQKELGVTEPFDPEDNIEGGVRYLRTLYDRFGSIDLALAAYNAGPHQVEKYRGIPPFRETEAYVTKVLARYKKKKTR